MPLRRASVSVVVALFVASPALASPVGAQPKASDLVHLLRSMHHRGELDAIDTTRLTTEAMQGIADGHVRPPSTALSRCSMLARFEARRWAHERGGNLAYPPPPSEGYVESTTLPLRVYYETSWDKPMAQDSLLYAEQAWASLFGDLGYPQPFTDDDDAQPIQGLWLYVADSGMGGGGYTEPLSDVPSTPITDCSSRVVIDSANPPEYVAEVVYHEMVHTSQMAMDCAESVSAFENFAVAAEHLGNPYSYSFPYGFLPEFQAWPSYAVDYWTNNDSSGSAPLVYYQYGAALFPVFLADRFGDGDPAYLPLVWRRFAQMGSIEVKPWKVTASSGNSMDWFQALHGLLDESGSGFHDAFREFARWRAVVGSRHDAQHFRYGADYPEPATAAWLSGATPASGTLRAREYGSTYVEYSPYSYQGGLRFTVTTDYSAKWTADLLLWQGSQSPEIVPLEFDGFLGAAVVPSVQGLSGITLVVSQLKDGSHDPDLMDYDNDRHVHYTMEVLDPSDAGVDADADADATQEEGGLHDAHDAASPDAAVLDSAAVPYDDAAHLPFDPSAYDAQGGGCGCRVQQSPPVPPFLALATLTAAVALRRRRRR